MSFYFPMLAVAIAIALGAAAMALLPNLIQRLPRRGVPPPAFRMKGDEERAAESGTAGPSLRE